MLSFSLGDWAIVFLHFMAVSLMAVGGAVTVIPEMHRHLVNQNAWMTEAQFSASIAIAQSAPGPNILVIAMMGWHIGINSAVGLYAQYVWGTVGMVVAMIGVMLPSSFSLTRLLNGCKPINTVSMSWHSNKVWHRL